MKKRFVAIIALLVLVVLPSVLFVEADAKMLPLPSQDHTRDQITTMLFMPAGLTGALALMLCVARVT
jgi:hypothetical protein